MTIPAAPLPEFRSLLRAVRAATVSGDVWAGEPSRAVRVYRSARQALRAGIEAVMAATPGAIATLWVPGYICEEALEALRRVPLAIRFYPVREDLTPEWPVLEAWATRSGGVRLLMLVHYFGFPNAAGAARDFCDRHGIVLVEDAAHVLRAGGAVGAGDVVVFSPRKLLATPSGGVLLIVERFARHLPDIEGSSGGRETAWWVARRLAQHLFTRLGIPWHLFRSASAARPAPPIGASDLSVGGCDPFALRLLAVHASTLDAVAARRRANYTNLLDAADLWQRARPMFSALPEGVCPYVFPVIVHGRTAAVAAGLQRRGVPASQWPDLPPEVLAAPTDHAAAMRIYERLLLLPVHQSLSPRQIGEMSRSVEEILLQAA